MTDPDGIIQIARDLNWQFCLAADNTRRIFRDVERTGLFLAYFFEDDQAYMTHLSTLGFARLPELMKTIMVSYETDSWHSAYNSYRESENFRANVRLASIDPVKQYSLQLEEFISSQLQTLDHAILAFPPIEDIEEFVQKRLKDSAFDLEIDPPTMQKIWNESQGNISLLMSILGNLDSLYSPKKNWALSPFEYLDVVYCPGFKQGEKYYPGFVGNQIVRQKTGYFSRQIVTVETIYINGEKAQYQSFLNRPLDFPPLDFHSAGLKILVDKDGKPLDYDPQHPLNSTSHEALLNFNKLINEDEDPILAGIIKQYQASIADIDISKGFFQSPYFENTNTKKRVWQFSKKSNEPKKSELIQHASDQLSKKIREFELAYLGTQALHDELSTTITSDKSRAKISLWNLYAISSASTRVTATGMPPFTTTAFPHDLNVIYSHLKK